MGSISARKLRDVVTNVRHALAIEMMTASAGLDQRKPLSPSRGVRAAHLKIRELVSPLTEDRPLYKDIAAVSALIASGELARAVEADVGALR